MKKFKPAFTLAEVLITLTVIGIVAILVVPGMIKDANAKSNMATLRNTIVNMSNAVTKEMTTSRARTIDSTTIATNPAEFLKTLDFAKTTSAFATNYRNYDGSNTSVKIPNNSTSGEGAVLLKNGVGVGIYNIPTSYRSHIIIDVNGPKEPNVVGVDYFTADLAWHDDFSNGIQAGDIGGYKITNSSDPHDTSASNSGIRSNCKSGNPRACYKAAELSGFDPLYIEK